MEGDIVVGGFSFGHMLVVLLVVILVFGTKKLSTLGEDLGAAIKGFRRAMANPDEPQSPEESKNINPQPVLSQHAPTMNNNQAADFQSNSTSKSK